MLTPRRVFPLLLAFFYANSLAFAESALGQVSSVRSPGGGVRVPARPSTEVSQTSHRPWVWKAERNGVVFYLAGCLHLGGAAEAACFPAYLPYFDRSPAVYFELMPSAWETREVGQLMTRRGYVPSRALLSSRLTPSAWQSVQQTLAADPALLKRVTPMEPWLVSITLAQEGYRRAGLRAENGLDGYLTGRAMATRKPIGALEKPKDQILAMADASTPDQEAELLGSLANYRQPDYATTSVRRAWQSGDLGQLRASFGIPTGGFTGGRETSDNLLGRRNAAWAKKISLMAANAKPALIVVGVEHLVTDRGSLPDLLEREGFGVYRVGGR